MKIISREEAIKKKLKRYYTGKECKNGHFSERKTINGQCIQCAYSIYKKRYERIKEALKND